MISAWLKVIIFSSKWRALALLLLLVPLYQNMSPIEPENLIDIRDQAPQKPKDYFNNPLASYFVDVNYGESMDGVGSGLLGKQIQPWLKQTEIFGLSLIGPQSKSYHSETGLVSGYLQSSHDRSSFYLQILNSQQIKLSYRLNPQNPEDWNLACQAEAGKGLLFSMNKSLTGSFKFGLSHEVQNQSSQVRMAVDW